MVTPAYDGKPGPFECKIKEFRTQSEKVKQDFASNMAEGRTKLAEARRNGEVSPETFEQISAKFDTAEREFYTEMTRSQQEFESEMTAAHEAWRRL